VGKVLPSTIQGAESDGKLGVRLVLERTIVPAEPRVIEHQPASHALPSPIDAEAISSDINC
jgi:hypothetical protein